MFIFDDFRFSFGVFARTMCVYSSNHSTSLSASDQVDSPLAALSLFSFKLSAGRIRHYQLYRSVFIHEMRSLNEIEKLGRSTWKKVTFLKCHFFGFLQKFIQIIFSILKYVSEHLRMVEKSPSLIFEKFMFSPNLYLFGILRRIFTSFKFKSVFNQ